MPPLHRFDNIHLNSQHFDNNNETNDFNKAIMEIATTRNFLVSKSLLFADTHNSHAMNIWAMSDDEQFIQTDNKNC